MLRNSWELGCRRPVLSTVSAVRVSLLSQVLEWAARHVQGIASGPGRFESEPAWRMAVSKRRAAAAPDSTFLQDMQQALTEAHVRPRAMSTACTDALMTVCKHHRTLIPCVGQTFGLLSASEGADQKWHVQHV